ncbi:MAG TPA: MFS transporter [Nocardioidaceae bacterium]|nr:MFS transporter [Nocardioidaceae bacterium]
MSVDSLPNKADPPPDNTEGHGHRHLGLALLLITTAQLMVVLDASIVNIAMPHIQDDLGFSDANLTWIITAYTIAFGGLLLLGGRMGDVIGRRKVFMFGVIVFAIASLFAGLAQSEWELILTRSLQGLGAAAAAPNALALITTTFPAGRWRNRAFATYAAMSGAGAAIGLILGGALTEASWRWTMLINVPIGIAVALAAPKLLGESKPQPGRWDVPGAITATLGLVSIVYGFNHKGQVANTDTGQLYTWTDLWTLGPIILGVALLVAFFVLEKITPHALLPLRIITDRTRAVSFVAMLIVPAAMFAMFLFSSLFIQDVLGYGSLQAGFAFLPFSAGIMVSAQIASNLASRVDPRWITAAGGVLASFGLWGYTNLDVDSTYVTGLLPWIIVQSLGMGLLFVPLMLTAVSRVDQRDAGVGSAVLNTMQQVGGSLGIAVLGTIYANGIADKMGELLQSGPPTDEQAGMFQKVAQTAGATDAFGVAMWMLIGATILTIIGLNIKHEDLSTDGQPGGDAGDTKTDTDEESATAVV